MVFGACEILREKILQEILILGKVIFALPASSSLAELKMQEKKK